MSRMSSKAILSCFPGSFSHVFYCLVIEWLEVVTVSTCPLPGWFLPRAPTPLPKLQFLWRVYPHTSHPYYLKTGPFQNFQSQAHVSLNTPLPWLCFCYKKLQAQSQQSEMAAQHDTIASTSSSSSAAAAGLNWTSCRFSSHVAAIISVCWPGSRYRDGQMSVCKLLSTAYCTGPTVTNAVCTRAIRYSAAQYVDNQTMLIVLRCSIANPCSETQVCSMPRSALCWTVNRLDDDRLHLFYRVLMSCIARVQTPLLEFRSTLLTCIANVLYA